MVTREELTELLQDIKVINYRLNEIVYGKNPYLRIRKYDEVRQLKKLLNDKFQELSSLCPKGEKYFYS